MSHLRSVPTWLILGSGIIALACDGRSSLSGARPEAGVAEAGLSQPSTDASQPSTGTPQSYGCVEARVEVEYDFSWEPWLPNRPLWMDAQGLHLAHVARDIGIRHHVFSKETGQEIRSQDHGVYPGQLTQDVGDIYGLAAVAASPQGDLAFAFRYTENKVVQQRVLSVSGGSSTVWTPPWQAPLVAFGLAWDGEGFTASLSVSISSSNSQWAVSRFSSEGKILSDVAVLASTPKHDCTDSETDSKDGTTAFVGADNRQAFMAWRRGRDLSVAPPRAPLFAGTCDVDIALHGATALSAWSANVFSVAVQEVSLDSGKESGIWSIDTGENPGMYQHRYADQAVAYVGDRWVIVGTHAKGAFLAEIRNRELQQRVLIRHEPACLQDNTCESGEESASLGRFSIITDGTSAWAGFLDGSAPRVIGERTLKTYRIVPLHDDCTYKTLASE